MNGTRKSGKCNGIVFVVRFVCCCSPDLVGRGRLWRRRVHMSHHHHRRIQQSFDEEGEEEIEGDEKHRVLVVSGWSPGPLPALIDAANAARAGRVSFVHADVPMPPVGFKWCMNPFCGLGVAYMVIVFYFGAVVFASFLSIVLTLVVTTAIGAFVVRGTVRYSIRSGVRSLSIAIERHRPHVLVGFSWGGGLLEFYLSENTAWIGPALLLSPTSMLMAQFAGVESPRIRSFDELRIVMARNDPFVPLSHIRMVETSCSAKNIFIVRDDHTLCSPLTVRDVTRSFLYMLRPPLPEGPSD